MRGLTIILLLPAILLAQPSDTLWTRMIGNSGYDIAADVVATSDGGMLVAGRNLAGADSGYVFRITKLDSTGGQVFSRVYGVWETSWCNAVAQTTDGGYIMAGNRLLFAWEVYVVKARSNGSEEWTFASAGQGDQVATSITQLTDGGYLVGGVFQNVQMFLTRLTADGQLMWTNIYPQFRCGDVFETPDGNYLVAGRGGYESNDMGFQYSAALLNQNGDTLWLRDYGTETDETYGGADMTDDGGLWIAGWSQDSLTNHVNVARISPAGDLLWQRTITENREFQGRAVSVLFDGGAIVAAQRVIGQTSSEMRFLRFAANGDTLWTKSWTFNTRSVNPLAIDTGPSGFAVAGWAIRNGGNYDMFAARVVGDFGRLTGHVRTISMQPLEGVRVSANAIDVMTDADGWYELMLPPGANPIHYEMDGYCSITLPIEIVSGGSLTRDTVLVRGAASFDVSSINIDGRQDQDVVFHMVHGGGECRIEYSVSDTSDWIIVTPAEGILEPGETAEFIAHFGLSELPAGEYLSEIAIWHAAAEAPYRIPVFAYVPLTTDENPDVIPARFGIASVYPNPFNAVTTFEIAVPIESDAVLKIYNVTGRIVAEPLRERLVSGVHRIHFDAAGLPSGVYFAALSNEREISLRKIVLMK